MAGAEAPAKRNADLPVRIVSALVMLAVLALVLWQGGLVWQLFVVVLALGILVEWIALVRRFAGLPGTVVWTVCGIVYLAAAAFTLISFHHAGGALYVIALAGAVIMTDVGAYFAGRTIGGPKIAPRISPSKTWAGLLGGAVLSTVFVTGFVDYAYGSGDLFGSMLYGVTIGPLVAVVAQAGDFFESWMKRRAGVKDSSHVIPGHGGLFDRMDGMIAVAAVLGLPLIMWLR